jgi:hypothetical protein
VENILKSPVPEILILNVNWHSNTVSYKEILNFSVAIPLRFRIADMYNFEHSSDDSASEFELKSLVCFVGAHYMTFIKHSVNQSPPVWHLYDDAKEIKMYTDWKDIISKIVQYQILPTLLIYEKVSDI